MRWVWLAALTALAILMAVLTPYVFDHESTSQTIGWSLMLALTIVGVGLLVRVELLIRELHRQPTSKDASPSAGAVGMCLKGRGKRPAAMLPSKRKRRCWPTRSPS